MKYTAINIGPIVSTLGMARKPRELWAASYLFSHLMKCIIETLPKDKIISPALFDKDEKNGIGLYPDRVFVNGADLKKCSEIIKKAFTEFQKTLFYYERTNNRYVKRYTRLKKDYFNLMSVSGNYDKDSEAIRDLNGKLDCMELFSRASKSKSVEGVRKLLLEKYKSPLFRIGFQAGKFNVPTLAEIASVELSEKKSEQWKHAGKMVEELETIPKERWVVEEDAFYLALKNALADDFKSYHKYICVVQADGDNVGKTVSHQNLSEGKVKEISEKLLDFGKNAKKAIDDFGGLPIYAGGDDLLFIAPVVGKDGSTILNLLDKLNDESFKCVADKVQECNLTKAGEQIKASLSFGVSISYYKYPLYEALENARNLLFGKAKKVDGKNAVAVDWRKHSGAAFSFSFSGNNSDLKKAFYELIKVSAVEESVVSAVAHKIRSNEGLLKLWIEDKNADKHIRNENFFKKFMEYNPSNPDSYKKATLKLMDTLCEVESDTEKLVKTMYGMLRTAKFINGEEAIDE